jgi:hypothetical protein
MSLLEWLLEPANPGPVGKLGLSSSEPEDDDKPPRKWLIWLAVVTGFLFLGVSLCWVFHNLFYIEAKSILLKLGNLALYVLTGHFVTAKPTYTNVGWLGGVVDNPFRISDDYNRWLVFIAVILLPGKLIAYSLVMSWLLGRHLYKKLHK